MSYFEIQNNKNNKWWLIVIEERKKRLSLKHPNPLRLFYKVVCTCWVFNTVFCFYWLCLYLCKHFGDSVISGFYKPQLFLKLTRTPDSFFPLPHKQPYFWELAPSSADTTYCNNKITALKLLPFQGRYHKSLRVFPKPPETRPQKWTI